MQLTGEGLLDEESAFKIRKRFSFEEDSDVQERYVASSKGCLPYESASVIMCDAELEVGPTIPTLGDYMKQFHLGGCTTIGLCINDYYEENEVGRSSFQPSPKLVRVYFKILLLTSTLILWSKGSQIKRGVPSRVGLTDSHKDVPSKGSQSYKDKNLYDYQCYENMPSQSSSSEPSVTVLSDDTSSSNGDASVSNTHSEDVDTMGKRGDYCNSYCWLANCVNAHESGHEYVLPVQ